MDRTIQLEASENGQKTPFTKQLGVSKEMREYRQPLTYQQVTILLLIYSIYLSISLYAYACTCARACACVFVRTKNRK